MTRVRGLAAIVLLLGLVVAPASAQGTSARPLRRLELAGGVGLFGGASLGSADAAIRANATPPAPFRLFSTDSTLGRAPVVEARVGTALTRRYAIEGRFSFSRPELRSSISADVEDAAGFTIVERVDQYLIDGALLVLLDEARLGGAVPFASAGAGYLRQLHEGLTVIESGRVYHIGGGIKHWLLSRTRGTVRAAGVRADARLYFLSGGIAVDDGPRPHGAVSASFFATF
jgi:hypothetical protein